MTENEAIKICNTIIFTASMSLSNPQGTPLNMTKEELVEAMGMAKKSSGRSATVPYNQHTGRMLAE